MSWPPILCCKYSKLKHFIRLVTVMACVVPTIFLAPWILFVEKLDEETNFSRNDEVQVSSDAIAFLQSAEDVLLNVTDKRRMLHLLRLFHQISQRACIDYMMSECTLLGAYRQSNLMDYCETLHVRINVDNRTAINRIFNDSARVLLKETAVDALQLYSPSLLEGRSTLPVWPFIRVTFFRRLDDLFVDIERKKVYHIDFWLPKIVLPLGDMLLPAPKCAAAALSYFSIVRDFLQECCTNFFNYRRGATRFRRARCIDCSLLRPVFASTSWRILNDTHAQEMIQRPRLNGLIPGRILYMPYCPEVNEEENKKLTYFNDENDNM